MRVSIKPGLCAGEISAPPSKSCAHRMLISAALADGESRIQGLSRSEDMLATLDCIAALGARASLSGDTAVITGGGNIPSGTALFPCRESGSTLRFMIPIAAACCGRARFTGTKRLYERGVGIYEELFAQKGIGIKKHPEGLEISGKLPPGEYVFRGDVSSQFVTGLLFALPLLEGDSVIRVLPPVESRGYIDLTLDVLKKFGVTVTEAPENTFGIAGGQRYKPCCAQVEGDWSNAAALLALNNLGGAVTVTGLNEDSIQGDRVCAEYLSRLKSPNTQIDISNCPDLGPVLMAAAAHAGIGAVFTGTRRLRIKESDRAEAMAQELRKFGTEVEVNDNSVIIKPGRLQSPTEILSGHNDHRIVMAMSLLASAVGGTIDDAQAVRKSYPDFFDVLRRLGLEVEYADK